MTPTTWDTCALGGLVEGGELSYGIVQPGVSSVGGVPIVRVKDISRGQIDRTSPMRVASDISDRHRRTILRGGELLMTIVGTIGECAVVPESMAGWNVARAIAVIRPEGVSPHWIRYCLQVPSVRASMYSMLNTTVQATLNLADLKRLRIPLPPADTRDAITGVLGAIDDKIGANIAITETALQLATESFRATAGAVSKRTRVALGDVARIVLGGTPSRAISDYWTNGTVPWLASGKANEQCVLEPTAWITETALRMSAAKMMPRGATLVAITGATLGQVARLEVEACGNQSLIGVWANDRHLNDWIYFGVNEEMSQLLRRSTGAAQQHVNKSDVQSLMVPMVDPQELSKWGSVCSPLLDLIRQMNVENLALTKTRDTLLPQLMSGETSVREAEPVTGEVA